MLTTLMQREAALAGRLRASWENQGCFQLLDATGQVALSHSHADLCPYAEPNHAKLLSKLAQQALEQHAPQRRAWANRHQVALPLSGPEGACGSCVICSDNHSQAEAHLHAQAILLEALLSREAELEAMTAELADAYDQLVSLYGVSDQMRQDTDLTDLLGSVIEQAARLVGARNAVVTLDGPSEAICHVYPGNWLGNVLADTVRQLVQQRQGLVMLNDPTSCVQQLHTNQINCMLAMPIYGHGQILGAIALFDKPGQGGFSAGNQKLLTSLAASVESYLERTSLQDELVGKKHLEHELELAAQIQNSLLITDMPAVPGIDLAAHCHPALQVGGDFYDLTANGKLSITIGDVASHGLAAAMLMPMVRTSMREAASQHPLPSWALTEVNARLYEDLSSVGLFVTAMLATYTPTDRKLVLANAGHTETLWWRRRLARAEWIMADCPPLGVLPHVTVEGTTITLEPGDILVAYSDGLTEAEDEHEIMFGSGRLLKTIQQHADATADEIAHAIFDAVDDFAHIQNDDQTIVILKVATREPL